VSGSDLPSVRAARPFAPAGIDLLREVVGAALVRAALHDTSAAFYRAG
jgi:hypothetical protein